MFEMSRGIDNYAEIARRARLFRESDMLKVDRQAKASKVRRQGEQAAFYLVKTPAAVHRFDNGDRA